MDLGINGSIVRHNSGKHKETVASDGGSVSEGSGKTRGGPLTLQRGNGGNFDSWFLARDNTLRHVAASAAINSRNGVDFLRVRDLVHLKTEAARRVLLAGNGRSSR